MSAVHPAQLGLFDARLARKEKADGMERASYHADEKWKAAVLDAIKTLAASGREFLSDDVRALCGDPPFGTSPNAMGSLFNAAARAGVIEFVGFGRSARVCGHSNTVRRWRKPSPSEGR